LKLFHQELATIVLIIITKFFFSVLPFHLSILIATNFREKFIQLSLSLSLSVFLSMIDTLFNLFIKNIFTTYVRFLGTVNRSFMNELYTFHRNDASAYVSLDETRVTSYNNGLKKSAFAYTRRECGHNNLTQVFFTMQSSSEFSPLLKSDCRGERNKTRGEKNPRAVAPCF